MRTFESFPKELKCPICGTNRDDKCFLIPLDGTAEGDNEQAAPVHTKCMKELAYRYNKKNCIIYAFTPEER